MLNLPEMFCYNNNVLELHTVLVPVFPQATYIHCHVHFSLCICIHLQLKPCFCTQLKKKIIIHNKTKANNMWGTLTLPLPCSSQ